MKRLEENVVPIAFSVLIFFLVFIFGNRGWLDLVTCWGLIGYLVASIYRQIDKGKGEDCCIFCYIIGGILWPISLIGLIGNEWDK